MEVMETSHSIRKRSILVGIIIMLLIILINIKIKNSEDDITVSGTIKPMDVVNGLQLAAGVRY